MHPGAVSSQPSTRRASAGALFSDGEDSDGEQGDEFGSGSEGEEASGSDGEEEEEGSDDELDIVEQSRRLDKATCAP